MQRAPEVMADHIRRTAEHVRQRMGQDSSGHDWWHIERVWQTAVELADAENANRYVVELAALLHDIADWKFADGDEQAGPQAARIWLSSLGVDAATVEHVCEIIATLSFKGAGVRTPMRTVEGAVVQDADRLDAIGAVGIARCFAYGGAKQRAMVDPEQLPEMHQSFAAYKKNSGPSINHFYEKLLLLRDRMNTASAKRMADERHRFMEAFLAQFFRECRSEPPVSG